MAVNSLLVLFIKVILLELTGKKQVMINYVLSGEGKAICDGIEETLSAGCYLSEKKAVSIVFSIRAVII